MTDHPNTLNLVIASVSETLVDSAAISVTLPGVDGQVTIMPHHEAFVTALTKGVITVRLNKHESREFPIERGVLECSDNRAVILL